MRMDAGGKVVGGVGEGVSAGNEVVGGVVGGVSDENESVGVLVVVLVVYGWEMSALGRTDRQQLAVNVCFLMRFLRSWRNGKGR